MADDDSKVVSIAGGVPVLEPGETSENVISFAEELLERAKSGKTVGLAIVECGPSVECNWSIRGFNTTSFTMLGAAHSMAYDLSKNATTEEPDG